MTGKFIASFGILLLVTSLEVAHAVPVEPTPADSESSPGLQVARRVASMENNNDLPSRAFWLSKKAAATTKLAYQAKQASKKKQPKTQD